MPEYLAPGVYVEETSFRAKSIEGVGTSTTAFVGPTRKGPFRADDDTPETPELLTSYGDFERIYGGFDDLALGGRRAGHELSRPRGPRLLQRRGIAAVRVARRRCGRGTAAAARPRRRAPTSRCSSSRVSPAGSATATSPCASSWRPHRWRRWPRPRRARCCASGPAAALAHHVKVGTDWRPAANLGEPGRRCRRPSPQRTPAILTLLTVATDDGGEVVSLDDMGFDRTHPALGRPRHGASGRRGAATISTTSSQSASARNVSGHRAARRAVRRRGGQRAGRNGAHLGS